MFDLSSYIDLPLVWSGILAFAILMYVVLDGFDLGIGILFPFAPTDECRDKMMSSIAPFWDGNETWLVLGGSGIMIAFPVAYAIIIPAVYLPIIFMLVGLIFRGVAFEFRFKAGDKTKKIWDYVFHFGSILATFCQGLILGTFVQGFKVENDIFIGEAFDWLSPFSITTGIALIAGYVLLGATWIIMKTEGEIYQWARKIGLYILFYVIVFMGVVSLWVPYLNDEIMYRWFTLPNFFYLMPIPIVSALVILMLARSLHKQNGDSKPFLLSLTLFVLCYIGLAISLWPWAVPHSYTIWQAAASPHSLSLAFIAVAILVPIILGYIGYCYYIFRGKVSAGAKY